MKPSKVVRIVHPGHSVRVRDKGRRSRLRLKLVVHATGFPLHFSWSVMVCATSQTMVFHFLATTPRGKVLDTCRRQKKPPKKTTHRRPSLSTSTENNTNRRVIVFCALTARYLPHLRTFRPTRESYGHGFGMALQKSQPGGAENTCSNTHTPAAVISEEKVSKFVDPVTLVKMRAPQSFRPLRSDPRFLFAVTIPLEAEMERFVGTFGFTLDAPRRTLTYD